MRPLGASERVETQCARLIRGNVTARAASLRLCHRSSSRARTKEVVVVERADVMANLVVRPQQCQRVSAGAAAAERRLHLRKLHWETAERRPPEPKHAGAAAEGQQHAVLVLRPGGNGALRLDRDQYLCAVYARRLHGLYARHPCRQIHRRA